MVQEDALSALEEVEEDEEDFVCQTERQPRPFVGRRPQSFLHKAPSPADDASSATFFTHNSVYYNFYAD
jgi:hypothetical protein